MQRSLSIFICSLLLIISTKNGHAIQRTPWSFGYDLLVLSDNNIGRAQDEQDIESDITSNFTFDGGYTWALNQTNAISLGAYAQLEKFQDFNQLSNQQFGLQFNYRFKTHFSFLSPSYSVLLKVHNENNKSDNRDGTTINVGLQYRQQLSDRIALASGINLNNRDSKSTVFDLTQTRYFLNIDYRFNNRYSLYFGYSQITGDVYSISTQNQVAFNWADAVEIDPAFTEEINQYNSSNTYPDPYSYGSQLQSNSGSTNIINYKYAYRLEAKTSIVRLGINIGINRTNSIDISADSLDSDAAGPITYQSTSIALNYLHRF